MRVGDALAGFLVEYEGAQNTGRALAGRSHARFSLRRFSMPWQSGTLFNRWGAHRLRSVFEEARARNRAYLTGRIANMEIKDLVTSRLKPS